MIRCTDFGSLSADEFGDYREFPLLLLWLVAGVFLGQLGPVLILIRPGDERGVRPIKRPVAQQSV